MNHEDSSEVAASQRTAEKEPPEHELRAWADLLLDIYLDSRDGACGVDNYLTASRSDRKIPSVSPLSPRERS